jgi:hypothetical protein
MTTRSMPASTMLSLRGALGEQLRDNARLKRQNAALRSVVLHQCAICRIAWCPDRERMARQALGRQWFTTRAPDP